MPRCRMVLAVVCFFLCVGLVSAQSPRVMWDGRGPERFKISSSKALPTLAIHKLLAQRVDMKALAGKELPLRTFVGRLLDQLPGEGKGLGVIVDTEAFLEEGPDEANILDAPVGIDARVRQISGDTMLRYVLHSRLPVAGTYRVKRGYIEITTATKAAQVLEVVLEPGAVNDPLAKILDDVSETTGVNIVLDIRAQEKAKTVVKAKFVNRVSLGAFLTVLTDMADLRHVVIEDTVYVTTRANAKVLEEEQKKKK